MMINNVHVPIRFVPALRDSLPIQFYALWYATERQIPPMVERNQCYNTTSPSTTNPANTPLLV